MTRPVPEIRYLDFPRWSRPVPEIRHALIIVCVCVYRDFCEMLFTSCSNSVWKGQLLGERFKNSSDFCLSRGYTIGNSPNLPDCFNSGVSLASNFWTVMACLCLFMLTGDKFRWKLLVTLMLLAVSVKDLFRCLMDNRMNNIDFEK